MSVKQATAILLIFVVGVGLGYAWGWYSHIAQSFDRAADAVETTADVAKEEIENFDLEESKERLRTSLDNRWKEYQAKRDSLDGK